MLQQINLAREVNYFRNLESCILEEQQAAQDENRGPSEPTNFSALCDRLGACLSKHPPLYRENVVTPYIRYINALGDDGFSQVILRDPNRVGEAGLMLDIAQAILQQGEGYNKKALDALQEVVSDLYDGFLSAEDRRRVKPPDLGVVAPLVKWGDTESGPYTWPVDCTINLGVKAAIISLPAANAQRGIFAWAALGHETAGHDIINADTGLRQELKECLYTTMQNANVASILPDYWVSRIDETASDVLGVLNMGPAAGISLIGYFRALRAARGGKPQLRNVGPGNDPHPADLLRGYLAASVVSLLNFSKADRWAIAIEAETDKDLDTIKLGESSTEITLDDAKESALIAARCLAQTKMKCLENHALSEIQNWHDEDELIVGQIRSILKIADPLPELYAKEDVYAAHVVAAAVVEALQGEIEVAVLFGRMIDMLKTLNDKNPSWGPLYMKCPGNVIPLKAYNTYKKARFLVGRLFHTRM